MSDLGDNFFEGVDKTVIRPWKGECSTVKWFIR
jgi:hypothetical protein